MAVFPKCTRDDGRRARLMIRVYLILIAIFGLPFLAIYLAVGPVHDFIGLRNTIYSSRFTVERYNQIQVGVPRGKVVDLLGEPLQTSMLTNYPAWGLRDDSVRRHYGTNAELQIETLSFSRPRNGGDYDWVAVWI